LTLAKFAFDMAGVFSLARTGRVAVSTAVAVAVFRKSRLSILSSRRAELAAEKQRQILFEPIQALDSECRIAASL
jgi:hypothetical protein